MRQYRRAGVNRAQREAIGVSCSDAPSLESLPVRLFRRSETRMPLRAVPGPALSAADVRTVARSHRSAHRSSGQTEFGSEVTRTKNSQFVYVRSHNRLNDYSA